MATLYKKESCPICSSLEPEVSDLIGQIALEKTFKKGDLVAQQGEPSEGFFLVLKGALRVYKSSANGKERVIGIVEPGNTFGEAALFGGGNYMESVEAIRPTTVLMIPKSGFLKLIGENPQITLRIVESLCAWIRHVESSVENSSFLSAREKLARFLLEKSRKEKKLNFDLTLKKREIAELLGITPETLSRTQAELEELGVVRVKGKKISVLKIEALQELAE